MIKKFLAAALFLTGTLSPLGAFAEESAAIRYGLCPRNIAKVSVESIPGDSAFALSVVLNPAAAAEFKTLTEANLKKSLEVWFDGALLERAPLKTSIGAGQMILGHWKNRDAATSMKAMLADSRLEVACGVIQ